MTPFGTTTRGEPVHKITLAAGDLTVSLLTLGSIVQSVRLAGVAYDLTQGSDTLADYEGPLRYHGALIGPVANRISNARAIINGMSYELERNQDGLFLHSGKNATHLHLWQVEEVTATTARLSITLADGVCGLPGNRTITALWEVRAPGTLHLTATATTDEPTLMNLANHSYWNLDGTDGWDGHHLRVAASAFLPCTDLFYPTGEIVDLDDAPDMDLRAGRIVSVHAPDFDNNYCLSDQREPLRDVCWLRGQSGVTMTIATTEPGLQVYDGRHAIRPGKAAFEGLAFEPQFWPDATNNPAFPSILLLPNDPWEQISEWRFSR